MPSLNDLPIELINNISLGLDRTDILAMRYVGRSLASTTTDAFFCSFTHISVSCSGAGLRRLEALVLKQDTIQKIKHVTLHTLTFKDMVDMAGLVPEGEPNPSVRVYADMRKMLLRCLTLLPKLEVITATNELLSGNASDHFPGPGWSSELDPFYRTEFRRAVDDRHWSCGRGNGDVPTYDLDILNENSIWKDGFTHGYEIILSILPALNNDVKLNLTVDYANIGPGCEPFHLVRPRNEPWYEVQSASDAELQQQMFGVENLYTFLIVRDHINELTLKNGNHEGQFGQERLLRAVQWPARMTALIITNMGDTFKNHEASLVPYFMVDDGHVQLGRLAYPSLTSLNVTGEHFNETSFTPFARADSWLVLDFLDSYTKHANVLKSVHFSNCIATGNGWADILEVLTKFPAFNGSNISITDCQAKNVVVRNLSEDSLCNDSDWSWEDDTYQIQEYQDQAWQDNLYADQSDEFEDYPSDDPDTSDLQASQFGGRVRDDLQVRSLRFTAEFTDGDDGRIELADPSIVEQLRM